MSPTKSLEMKTVDRGGQDVLSSVTRLLESRLKSSVIHKYRVISLEECVGEGLAFTPLTYTSTYIYKEPINHSSFVYDGVFDSKSLYYTE